MNGLDIIVTCLASLIGLGILINIVATVCVVGSQIRRGEYTMRDFLSMRCTPTDES